jgi:azurin
MQYAQKELRAKAGERLSVTFENNDVMQHNWVLVKADASQRVGLLSNEMLSKPDALFRHFVPTSPDVLCYTRVVDPKKSTTVNFTAPTQPGRYPYICTFPGHWAIMHGVLIVE